VLLGPENRQYFIDIYDKVKRKFIRLSARRQDFLSFNSIKTQHPYPNLKVTGLLLFLDDDLVLNQITDDFVKNFKFEAREFHVMRRTYCTPQWQ